MSYNIYTQVQGKYGSLASFYIPSGNQESITGRSNVALDCYHSKLYTVDNDSELTLNRGLQNGQKKLLTLVFKGIENSKVTVNVPDLSGVYTRIEFSEVGDQCELLWTGGVWIVLVTYNLTDLSRQSPVVL